MFKKKALTTAVQAAMVVSAATLMQGCNLAEEKSTSKVSGIFEQVRAPKGTVMGVVQDTNGNPLKGVKVVLGSKTTRTNAGGQYQFNGVAVVNTVNLDDETNHESIQVTVVAPEGYLGATVTVYPQAQIDGMDNADTDTQDQTGNQVTTFIDGYTASAGTAVLPMLNATVTGILRDTNTGEVIQGQEVALDFLSTNNGNRTQEQSHDGVRYSYATPSFSAVSAGTGAFSISMVPNDSCLRFVVGNYEVNYAQYNTCDSSQGVLTNDEVAVVNVEDLWVTPHAGGDDVNPFFLTISGVTPDSDVLDRGVNGTGAGITFTLSEPVAERTLYDVKVVDADNSTFYDATVTMNSTRTALTVVTATALPAGVEVHFNFVRADLSDEAGNAIEDCQEANELNPYNCNSDSPIGESIVTADTGVEYLRVILNTWEEANLNAQAVVVAQVLAGEGGDPNGTDDDPVYQAINDAYVDYIDGDNNEDFQGLNSSDNDDGLNGIDAEERLSDLLDAQGASATADQDVALVYFTPSNASWYEIEVNGTGATIDQDPFDGFSSTALAVSDNINDLGGNDFEVTDSETVYFGLDGVEPGDVVTIRVYDDLDYEGSLDSEQLVDVVPPTTVINKAYRAGDEDPVVEGDAEENYGNGGELSSLITGLVDGTPTLNITPALLDNIDPSGEDLDDELLAFNTQDTSNNLIIDDGVNYDSTAWLAFAANLQRTIGIAMSEDIVVSETINPTTSATTSATLSGWTAHNDSREGDDGSWSNNVNVDLVDVTVSNIMNFANNDHGVRINLAPAISDTAGNTTTTASVVVQDFMPPYIVSAQYNGSNFTIEFNEPVMLSAGDRLDLFNAAGVNYKDIVITQAIADLAENSDMDEVLEIPSSAWGDDIFWAGAFNLGDYVDTNAGGPAGTDVEHGSISFAEVEDLNGNSWDSLDGILNWDMLDEVRYAFINTVTTAFALSAPAASNFNAGNTQFTVTYTATHPMDLTEMFGAASATVMTGAEVATAFDYDSNNSTGDAIDGTATFTGASLNTARTVLTVTIELDAPATAAEDFDLVGNGGVLESDYDSSQQENPAPLTANP